MEGWNKSRDDVMCGKAEFCGYGVVAPSQITVLIESVGRLLLRAHASELLVGASIGTEGDWPLPRPT